LLLHFVDNYEETVDQEDFISPRNPTMTFSGNNVVIDYSLAYIHSEDAKKSIQSFFNSKNVIGQTLTLKDANYTNPLQQGNGDVFDAAGTYTINSFDEESGIVVATKVTANNLSDYISQYLSDYWIDNLKWTESSTSMTRVIEENSIVNRAGVDSINSFANTLGEVLVGDILTLQFPNKKETSKFTVTGTRTSDAGHEWISVDEPVPDDAGGTTYFGSKIYITVSRREEKPYHKQSRSNADYEYPNPLTPDGVIGQDHLDWFLWFYAYFSNPVNSDPQNPQIPDWSGYPPLVNTSWGILSTLINNQWNQDGLNTILDQWGTGAYPLQSIIPPDSDLVISERQTDTDTTTTPPPTNTTQTRSASPSYNTTIPNNRSAQSEAKTIIEEKWNETGRNTVNVRVNYRNGKRVYAFNGAGQNTESRPELMLEEGVVYRFNLTDRSLGRQGGHPLSFATSHDGNINGSELHRYITRSNKKPGNRGAYIYFEVPATGGEIYYYCKNHNGMGNVANVMLKRGSDEGPVIYPDVKPGVGPGGGGGVTGINECCDCDNCLMQAIMEVESGDWQNPGTKDPIEQCNARRPGGNGCGHYQIFPAFVEDARGLCPTPGVYSPGAPKIQACCAIPANAHDILCADCTTTACCNQKKALGELIMACWKRKWTRNQGSGPCRCEGSGPGPVVDDEDCYTCEDLAKMHKEGKCGHQCCTKPNCCYQGDDADPAEGTDACSRAKQYWNRVQSVMCSIPACASCSDCANVSPPNLESKPKRPGEERSTNTTTTPRPRTVTTPQTTTPRPRTTTAPSYTPSTTQPPMSGGSMGGGGYSSGY